MDSSLRKTDFVLEIKLLKVALEESLEIDARARLLSVDTGAVLNDSQYQFLSAPHELSEWMADGAAPLKDTIEYGLQTLAEDIINENFLLFYPSPPHDAAQSQNGTPAETSDAKPFISVPYYVLAPVTPKIVSCILCGEHPFSRTRTPWLRQEFVKVEGVQPTLRWQSFPRKYDLDKPGRDISEVVYDLRVFRIAETNNKGRTFLAPDTQIYSSRAIVEPEHKIAVTLEECTEYMWTVRARFLFDQQVRVTEWAGTFPWPPWDMRRFKEPESKPFMARFLFPMADYRPERYRPEWFYYPFKTPCGEAHN
jgi:hypothetical protein